ncbi:HAD family hydrolase [Pseudofrankia saprophytica]|uniref:HAD family hydrolase n=1 Tax=Pseudofrankia saprophytica TaxID=298655 RepID=UPI000234D940|nr:HAD family hydrolase [Pseudofrankia saprophytica]
MLFLDFDGVICDAFTECAVVAWHGHHRAPDGPPPELDATILPARFVDDFRRIRPYARTLGGFLVAHHPDVDAVDSQDGYEMLLATFSADDVAGFERRAGAVRTRLRLTAPRRWLEAHRVYPQVGAAIARHDGRVVVVTAKDAVSAGRILAHHGLREHVADIIGDCVDKPAAINAARARAGHPARVLFVDDNLGNVVAAVRAGVPSLWARWGYHTAEQLRLADRDGVTPIELAELAELTV